MPDDLRLERERLLAEGFPEWRKTDVTAFIGACEKVGHNITHTHTHTNTFA